MATFAAVWHYQMAIFIFLYGSQRRLGIGAVTSSADAFLHVPVSTFAGVHNAVSFSHCLHDGDAAGLDNI